MPTARPFSDRADVDPEGNIVPIDTPTNADVLKTELHREPTWPVKVAHPFDIEIVPTVLGAAKQIAGEAIPYTHTDPELALPYNPRRANIVIYDAFGPNEATWRIGRTAADCLRDETALIFALAIIPRMVCRFAWN